MAIAAGEAVAVHSPRSWAIRMWNEIANRSWLAAAIVSFLPLVIRALSLRWAPIPKPMITDEFSHLLIADTVASGRLVNPTHPFWRHFETFYEFQKPVYASIYPPGQGVVLALGQIIGGDPWWGIWASCGLMCGAVYWMLAGWAGRQWALVGGLICLFRIGLFSYWMNSYLGGSVSALGGALALGALPRLMKSNLTNAARARLALTFGSGLAIAISIRPYEGALFAVATSAILVFGLVRGGWRPFREKAIPVLLPIAGVALVSAAGLAYYNSRITGSPWVMPYQLSQQIYGVPRGLLFQPPNRMPNLEFQDQRQLFNWQNQARLRKRFKWRLFRDLYLGVPLIVALMFVILSWRNPAMYMLAGVSAVLAVGANYYWFFLAHYVAAGTAAFLGLVVFGLRELWNWSVVPPLIRRWAVAAIVLADISSTAAAGYRAPGEQEFIDFSESRAKVEQQLISVGGRHLVFVRPSADHPYELQWIYNRANIDAAEIVWAREIDPAEDARLAQYFGGRSIWIAEVDEKPVRLTKWTPPSAPRP